MTRERRPRAELRGAAVERREAPRARSRRFAQADRPVARATPEARASGNIRPRGVAPKLWRLPALHSTPLPFGEILRIAFAKLGRACVARTRAFIRPRASGGGGPCEAWWRGRLR